VDGSGLHRLTHTEDAFSPVWSPDGRQIVFAREHQIANGGVTASLWTIHVDGSGIRPLLPGDSNTYELPNAFSQDGRLLAFTRGIPSATNSLENTNAVFLLRLADGHVRELAEHASDAAFSPDGRWVALTSTRDHNGIHATGEDSESYAGDLYLVDLSGKHWHRLPDTNAIDEDYPSFSPDGQRIAYERTDSVQTKNSSDDFHHAVWEINTDGSCPTRVRDDAADIHWYFAPAWRPGVSVSGGGWLRCKQARSS
jgi:Tol biopolymer transport system component